MSRLWRIKVSWNVKTKAKKKKNDSIKMWLVWRLNYFWGGNWFQKVDTTCTKYQMDLSLSYISLFSLWTVQLNAAVALAIFFVCGFSSCCLPFEFCFHLLKCTCSSGVSGMCVFVFVSVCHMVWMFPATIFLEAWISFGPDSSFGLAKQSNCFIFNYCEIWDLESEHNISRVSVKLF